MTAQTKQTIKNNCASLMHACVNVHTIVFYDLHFLIATLIFKTMGNCLTVFPLTTLVTCWNTGKIHPNLKDWIVMCSFWTMLMTHQLQNNLQKRLYYKK